MLSVLCQGSLKCCLRGLVEGPYMCDVFSSFLIREIAFQGKSGGGKSDLIPWDIMLSKQLNIAAFLPNTEFPLI